MRKYFILLVLLVLCSRANAQLTTMRDSTAAQLMNMINLLPDKSNIATATKLDSTFFTTIIGQYFANIVGRFQTEWYNALDFPGVVADGATNVTTQLQAAFDSAKTNNKNLLIPRGNYVIDSLVIAGYNQRTVQSYGSFTNPGGTATIILETSKHLKFSGQTNVDNFRIEDIWYSSIVDVECDSFVVAPHNATWGQFWSTFRNIHVKSGPLEIDVAGNPVNQNAFINIRSKGLNIFESTSNSKESHANDFLNCDFTNGYIVNSTSKRQYNNLRGCYIETITGGNNAINDSSNFHVMGMHGDFSTTDFVQPEPSQWYIMNDHVSSRNSDFAPVSSLNLFQDGGFKFVNSDGTTLPAGITKVGGTGSAWDNSDLDAPNSSRRTLKISATAGQTFRYINVDIKTLTRITSFAIWYQGYVKTIETYKVDSGSGTLLTSFTPNTSSADTSRWRIFHTSIQTDAVGDTAQLRIYVTTTSEASNRQFKIGYISATPNRIALPWSLSDESNILRRFKPLNPVEGMVWMKQGASAAVDTLFVYINAKWQKILGTVVNP